MQSQHLELLPLDQQHLVRRAAAGIEAEFAGMFGRETVERFVADSLAQLVPTARFTMYVPLLTERFARERLRAFAKARGLDDSGAACAPCALFRVENFAAALGQAVL